MNTEYDFHICSIGESRRIITTSSHDYYGDTLAIIFCMTVQFKIVKMPVQGCIVIGEVGDICYILLTRRKILTIKTSNYALNDKKIFY